jgi:hypothetical protein
MKTDKLFQICMATALLMSLLLSTACNPKVQNNSLPSAGMAQNAQEGSEHLSSKVAAGRCSDQLLAKEIQQMRTSPYWKKQIEKFGNVMNQTFPRGCSSSPHPNETAKGFDIFMDDLEFTASLGGVLATSGAYGTEHTSQTGKTEIFANSTSQSQILQIKILLKSGYMSLEAETCSPKEAFAYMIAYAPYTFKAHCGENTQYPDVTEQVNEILQNENM